MKYCLCFIVKDNDEVLFYLKMLIVVLKPTALWITSESRIYSKNY